jgi:hypothetical protein
MRRRRCHGIVPARCPLEGTIPLATSSCYDNVFSIICRSARSCDPAFHPSPTASRSPVLIPLLLPHTTFSSAIITRVPTPIPFPSSPSHPLPSPTSHLLSPHSTLPASFAIASSVPPNFTTLNLSNRGSSPRVRCTICCVCALASKRMMK